MNRVILVTACLASAVHADAYAQAVPAFQPSQDPACRARIEARADSIHVHVSAASVLFQRVGTNISAERALHRRTLQGLYAALPADTLRILRVRHRWLSGNDGLEHEAFVDRAETQRGNEAVRPFADRVQEAGFPGAEGIAASRRLDGLWAGVDLLAALSMETSVEAQGQTVTLSSYLSIFDGTMFRTDLHFPDGTGLGIESLEYSLPMPAEIPDDAGELARAIARLACAAPSP